MTQILDRPTTEVDVRTQPEVRPRPIELDREVRQIPPVGEPPGRFRWLGWLLGIAAVAAVAWLVIAEITADDTPVASPSYVVIEGAITADPKARTPVVTLEMVNESIRTGIPGTATLTEISTFGPPSTASLEDATVNPMIFWAVQPTYATNMEEATVSPLIYEAAAPGPNHVTKSAYPGVYWSPDIVLEERPLFPDGLEMTFGMWPTEYAAPVGPSSSVIDGAYWRYDLVLEERPLFPEGLDMTFGMWPTIYAEPPVTASTHSHGGHSNIMR